MPEIAKLLSQLTSGDDLIAEDAVKMIAQVGTQVIEKLADLLNEENADNRWWAIRALAEIDDPQTDKYIIKHLEDKNTAVQQCAAVALRIKPNNNSIDFLLPLLDHDDSLLSKLATDALIANGEKATLGLLELLQNGSQKAKIQAVRALATIADTSSISALFSLLDSESAIIEYWANEGLNKMGIGMTFFDPK